MRREYNKLVRDRIPEIIERSGREFEAVRLSEEEYRRALLEKLVEEAQEVAEAGPQKIVAELADLYEVIDALIAMYGISRDSVMVVQQQRRIERGEFHHRIKLLWVDDSIAPAL